MMILRNVLLLYQYSLGSIRSHSTFIDLSLMLLHCVFHLHLSPAVEQGYNWNDCAILILRKKGDWNSNELDCVITISRDIKKKNIEMELQKKNIRMEPFSVGNKLFYL